MSGRIGRLGAQFGCKLLRENAKIKSRLTSLTVLQLREREIINDPPPVYFGFLEVDEKAYGSVRSAEVIETLCGVFVRKALGAFQFDNENVFDQDVGEVFTYWMAFVGYREGGFGSRF